MLRKEMTDDGRAAQRLLHSKQFIISACVVKEVRVTMLQFAFTSFVIN